MHMKKLKEKFLKIFTTILAACGITGCFVACYGMPVKYNHGVNFKVRADLNDDGTISDDEVVEDIAVEPVATVSDYEKNGDNASPIYPVLFELTNEKGEAYITLEAYEDVIFETSEEYSKTDLYEKKRVTVKFDSDEEFDNQEVSIELTKKSTSSADKANSDALSDDSANQAGSDSSE